MKNMQNILKKIKLNLESLLTNLMSMTISKCTKLLLLIFHDPLSHNLKESLIWD